MKLLLQFRSVPNGVGMRTEGLTLNIGQTAYLVRRWPDLGFYFRSGTGEYRLVPDYIRPALGSVLHALRLSDNQSDRLAAYELVRELPLWIHARLVRMGQHYWLGLETLSKLPESRGLLEGSPALFAVVAQYADAGLFRGISPAILAAKLRGRQRELMQWLGLGESEALCKILRKFSHYGFRLSQWRALARNLRKPGVGEVMQQARVISPQVLDFLAEVDNDHIFSPEAVAEIIAKLLADGNRWESRSFIDGILSFGALFRRYGITKAPLPSIALCEKLRSEADQILKDLPLPVGPEIPMSGATPILTPVELTAEGTQMEHCVGSTHYILEGLAGRYCFYRVLHPARATICLRRNHGFSPWELDQVAGHKNSKIPRPALDSISEALRLAGVRTGSGIKGN